MAAMASEDFITYIANRKFHQTFQLPPNKATYRDHSLRITYADFGYQDDAGSESEAVILICGPMMGTRYLHISKDALAIKHKVRIIHPDRFGFGGTAQIGADERVKMWLELVPALLAHLNIKHVSIVAQSGGTIYALNTILYLRHLLHPTAPYLALGAPWVHPSYSGATAMQLTSIFPNSVLDHLDTVAHWVREKVMPVTGFSSGIVGAVSGAFTSLVSIEPGGAVVGEHDDEDEATFVFDEEIRPVAVNLAYAESVQGLGQEALLFLKRGDIDAWGPWRDYHTYAPMLKEAEKLYRENKSGTEMQKLKIDVFYAEEDIMIGVSAGPEYMDACWEECGNDIAYESVVVKGADHDGVFNMRWGIIQQVFAEVRRRSDVLGVSESMVASS